MPVNFAEIAKKLSQNEATKELSKYWQQRYLQILESGRFKLSNKTIEHINLTEELKKPVTPFGDLSISSHVGKNGLLDESSFQVTVETTVRLLDSCLDSIKFSPEVKKIIELYRKIGVGIANFKEYFELQENTSIIKNIDYLGSLVASKVYRASEHLAQEKGVPKSWKEINQHLRLKFFEIWSNHKTGEIKNGLELSEIFDNELIKQTDFKIIPRRNSHLLVFPPDLEWEIWSDRDGSLPTSVAKTVGTNNLEEEKQDETKTDLEKNEKLKSAQSVIIGQKKTEPVNDLKQSQNFNYFDKRETSKNLKKTEFSQPDLQVSPTFSHTEAKFQIGELVRLADSQPQTDKIFQIIDVIENAEKQQFRYRLMGPNKQIENGLWKEKDLIAADLKQILEKLNGSDQYNLNLFVNAIIVNEENQILVENTPQKDKFLLPGDKVKISQNLQEQLRKILQRNYKIKTESLLDIFAVQEIHPNSKMVDLHLAIFTVVQEFGRVENLFWLDLDDEDGLFDLDKKLVKQYKNYEARIHQRVDLEIEDKIKAKLAAEMSMLPTEEEIEHRIQSEVAFRIQEKNNQEESPARLIDSIPRSKMQQKIKELTEQQKVFQEEFKNKVQIQAQKDLKQKLIEAEQTWQQKLSAVENDKLGLEKTNSQLFEQNTILQKKVATLEAAKKTGNDSAELVELQQKLNEIEKQNKTLKQQLDQQNKEYSKNSKDKEQIQKLELERAELQKLAETHFANLQEKEEEIKKLQEANKLQIQSLNQHEELLKQEKSKVQELLKQRKNRIVDSNTAKANMSKAMQQYTRTVPNSTIQFMQILRNNQASSQNNKR